MAAPLVMHPDRLFPAEPRVRAIARELFAAVAELAIVSPYGHVDPRWFATDTPFTNATELLLAPDHYLFRMLRSHGLALERLGVPDREGLSPADPREAWRLFAANYRLFRATPSALWLDQVFSELFGLEVRLGADTADLYFDRIGEALATPAFRPRALYDRFGIEVLATTEGALDPLEAHRAIRASGWAGRVITTYRPDAVIDPEHEDFQRALDAFAQMTGEDARSWRGYLAAHRRRRADFRAMGATATDHGHVSAATADLTAAEAAALFDRVQAGRATGAEAELFRAQMLT